MVTSQVRAGCLGRGLAGGVCTETVYTGNFTLLNPPSAVNYTGFQFEQGNADIAIWQSMEMWPQELDLRGKV